MYEIRYSESFQNSLAATISYWQQKLELSDDKLASLFLVFIKVQKR